MPSRAAGVSASGGPLPLRGLFRYLVDFALAEYRNLHQNHVAGVKDSAICVPSAENRV